MTTEPTEGPVSLSFTHALDRLKEGSSFTSITWIVIFFEKELPFDVVPDN